MSDAVGKSWVEELKKFCDETISDMHFRMMQKTAEHNKPTTKKKLSTGFCFGKSLEDKTNT